MTCPKLAALALTALLPLALLGAGDPEARRAEGIATAFRGLDRDGDGKLTGPELESPKWLRALDKNHDGAVTLEEAQTVLARFLQPPDDAAPATAELAPPFPVENSPREGALRVPPREHGIGEMVPDAGAHDLDGQPRTLGSFHENRALVVALFSPSCPISKRNLPTLATLAATYRGKGVAFALVAAAATDTPAELRAALAAGGLEAPCLLDSKGAVARALGAKSTTDVFVLDAARTLLYRGAIDDQYGLGYSLDAPRHRYLADALDAALAGRRPEIAATEAPGCLLDLSKIPPLAATAPTFHGRISRLLAANCQECHRTGGVAPFPLETYEQASAKAGMIRKMVERDLMPPWFAARPAPGGHSPWANDRSLAARDKADLIAWLAAGKPLGDPRDAALPRQWPVSAGDGAPWQLGKPDAIVQIPQSIEVRATGTMPYQNVTVETAFGEDKWVRGLEVQPTAREVVHHVLVFVREKGKSAGREGDLGGFFAAYVPGNNAVIYPEGFAKSLPAGASLRFQIHYTPNGTATHDQVRLGLLFSKEPPRHVVQIAAISNLRLSIPPGAENHPESGTISVPREVRLLGFMPHMHVRGKAFRFEALLPDGSIRTLLDVPRYDFNWQLAYRYAEPPALPAGSRVRATGWFDNSAGNPANPDPAKTVRWGPQTTDEMMLGYVEYYVPEAATPAS